jgi:MerR family transcriptional regulator, thiopeptide resistance regulator
VPNMRTVGELSQLTGVTVRTLHHYDEIGLLPPSGRSDAGYRLYAYADLTRLQEILVWRQLGFTLSEIQQLLDDPARALDAALAAHQQGIEMEVTSMFDDFDPAEYEEETRERWGHSEAYKQSARRTARYGEREWAEIKAETDQVVRDFTSAMQEGEPADGERARAVAERHRQHITRWFYPVFSQMHRNLAEMYISDPRFAANYEKVAEGLAMYVHDAVLANASAQEAGVR